MSQSFNMSALKKLSSLRILMTLAVIAMCTTSTAQQDTLFWFAAPEISSSQGESPIHLKLLSYDNAATVTISQPANGAFTPIVVNLAANDVSEVDLTPFITDIESPSANTVNTNGLKIESSEIITCYYEVLNSSNKEIFSLKGNAGLGDDFYTPFQEFWDNDNVSPATFSSFEIVATENNTTVVITPKADIVGHTVGSTFNVTLDEGETYSARDVNLSASSSLSGSIVSADKPVSVTVFSGAVMNNGCNSTMGDQITPSNYLGTDFVLHKGTSSDRIFILAAENNTSISIENTGTTTSLINWSETYEYDLNETYTSVHTSKPVYLLHASGFGCNLSAAQVPNVYCAGKYDQTFTRSTSDSLGVLLHVRTGFEDDFTLNGNPSLIQASDFTVVPGTGGEFMIALIYFNTADVPVGSFNRITNSGDIFGMALVHGGDSQGAAYGYLTEFNSYPFVDAGTDATICQNVPFNLSGVVGGGDVTGTWSSNGFGSFSDPLDQLNNTYNASVIDTIISPINLILTSTGPCPQVKDTLVLTVTPAPIINAGVDQIVCANNADVSLSGSVSGGATGGAWSTTGSGTFSPSNTDLNATYTPSSADAVSGSVELVLTSTGVASCNNETDTMLVQITPAPVVDIPEDTIFVCSNNPNFNLSGTVSGGTTTGKWTTTGNGIFSPDNLTLNCSYTPSPTDVNGGEITMYLQSTNNGLCFGAEDSVVVIFTSDPQVNAGPDLFACTNEPGVVLNGSVSGPTTTGTWSGGAGSFSPDANSLNASYIPTAAEITSGSVTLTLTSTNNGTCLAENDQVELDFVSPPFANFNFNNACLGDTVQFTDFSLNGFGSIVNWTYDFGDGNSDTIANPIHIYGAPGSYNAQLIVESSAGCFDTSDVSTPVEIFEKPVADFNYSATCTNDQVIVDFTDASSIGNGTINSWYYDFGGMGNQAVQNPSQLFVGTGNFTITQIVETTDGCSDTTIQLLNVPPKPNAGFFYNTDGGLNIGAEFTFVDTSSNTASWYWDFGNDLTSSQQNPSTVYFENGNYIVTLWATGPLGCVDSVSKTITINTVTTEVNQLIPNAISPNGDGFNDVWKLEFIDFLDTPPDIVIVNRWGQTVFQSVGYPDPWDGTFQNSGEMVPEGNYYYIIKVSDDEIYEGALLVLISGKN